MPVYYEGCRVVKHFPSGLAILVDIPDVDREPQSVPKSVIDREESDIWDPDDEGTLAVRTWFAEKEGWPT